MTPGRGGVKRRTRPRPRAGRAGPIVAGLDALGAAVAATGSSLGPSNAVALADSAFFHQGEKA